MIGLVMAESRRFVEVRERRPAAGSVVLALCFGPVIGSAGITWRLTGELHPVYSPLLTGAARTLFGCAVLVLVLAVAVCFVQTRTTSRTASPRLWFFVFAFISGTIAAGLEVSIRVLQLIASGQYGV